MAYLISRDVWLLPLTTSDDIYFSETCGYYCAYYTDSMFAMAHPGAGRGLTFLAGHGIIFFFILFLIESNWAHQVTMDIVVTSILTKSFFNYIVYIIISHQFAQFSCYIV